MKYPLQQLRDDMLKYSPGMKDVALNEQVDQSGTCQDGNGCSRSWHGLNLSFSNLCLRTFIKSSGSLMYLRQICPQGRPSSKWAGLKLNSLSQFDSALCSMPSRWPLCWALNFLASLQTWRACRALPGSGPLAPLLAPPWPRSIACTAANTIPLLSCHKGWK